MKNKSDKDYFEFLMKNILQFYNLIDSDLKKGESPDFANDKIGLEITRADPTLEFDGFIKRYNKDNMGNIKKFNKSFEKAGGKVFNRNDPIVKILNLIDCYNFNDDYVYIRLGYDNDFKLVNSEIINKLKKLNKVYKSNLDYYLGIFSPILASKEMIINELNEIINIQSEYPKKYIKIIIVFIDKICVFDLKRNTYKIINDTENTINDISYKTYIDLNK